MQQIKKKNTKNIGFLIIAENSSIITFSDIHKIHTQEYNLIMYIMALIYSDSWAEFSFSFLFLFLGREGKVGTETSSYNQSSRKQDSQQLSCRIKPRSKSHL